WAGLQRAGRFRFAARRGGGGWPGVWLRKSFSRDSVIRGKFAPRSQDGARALGKARSRAQNEMNMTPANMIRQILAIILAVVAILPPSARAATRGLPPQQGILNFGKINDSLYRGAQPDALGITNLSRLGIKTIVNLRMPNSDWNGELATGSANGILCTNINFH